MIGKLKDLRIGGQTQTLVIALNADFREPFDELKDGLVDVTIEKHSGRRSPGANSYVWKLCDKIARRLSKEGIAYTKKDIYREAIKDVGVYIDKFVPAYAAEETRREWESQGIGFVTESSAATNETTMIRCYIGSSQYTKAQMSILIDNLVQDAAAIGIETDAPDEIQKIKNGGTL